MNWMNRLLNWNHWASASLDRFVNQYTRRRSGMAEFRAVTIPELLQPGMRVLDVGSGKCPLIDQATRLQLGLHVTGLDISAEELQQAPDGSYDETVVMDAAAGRIPGRYDLILSHTVLEHVRDTPAAIFGLTEALVPGGTMAHFLPCRNAVFARLNLSVGNRVARRLLKIIYPGHSAVNGFPAYYNRCTPRQLGRLCKDYGLNVVETRAYFASSYLRFLAPLHALDLVRQVSLMWLGAESLCETFTLIARKPDDSSAAVPDRAVA